MFHSDYLAPTFLLTLIFVQLVFIIYLNVVALINYSGNQVITLTGTNPQCNIEGVAQLNSSNICTDGTTYSGQYFTQTPQNTYTLGKVPKTNYTVCSSLCTNSGGSISKTGDCSKSIAAYTNCLIDLLPVSGCKQASKPLAQLKVNSQTVYYYAQNLVQNSIQC